MDDLIESMPLAKAYIEVAIKRGVAKMLLEREVPSNRTEDRQKGWGTLWQTKAAFARWLIAIFGAFVPRAPALTDTCLTLASSGILAFDAGIDKEFLSPWRLRPDAIMTVVAHLRKGKVTNSITPCWC